MVCYCFYPGWEKDRLYTGQERLRIGWWWDPGLQMGLLAPFNYKVDLDINSFLSQEIPLESIYSLIELLLHLGHSSPSVYLSSFLSGDSSSNSFILPVPTPGVHHTCLPIPNHCRVPLDSLRVGSTQRGMGIAPSLPPTFPLPHG